MEQIDCFNQKNQIIIQEQLLNINNKTTNGDTQISEKRSKVIIEKILLEQSGYPFEHAGSQQSIDFRNVRVGDNYYNYELKKVNTGDRFMFNDSTIVPDVYYILNYVQKKRVVIKKGSTILDNILIKDNDTVYDSLDYLKKIVLSCDITNINSTIVFKIFNAVLCLAKQCVFNNIMTLSDYGEMFKNTTRFGNVASRPRPNWTFKIVLD